MRDAAVVLRVLASLVRVGRLLRQGGFARAVQELDLSPDRTLPERAAPLPASSVRDVRVAVRVTRLLGDRVTCLHKALALQQVLCALDVPSSVVVGVRDEDGLAAHAWLATPHGPIDPNRRDPGDFEELGRFAPAGMR